MAKKQQNTRTGVPRSTTAPRGPRLGRVPFWALGAGLVAVVASWIPLVFAAKARVNNTEEPRIQLMQDMAWQPKYVPQSASPIFADGRSMRTRIEGTVPRGHLDEDDHYYRGYTYHPTPEGDKGRPVFLDGYPSQVKVTPELLQRGQQRFNIYCAACHGQDGYGHGPVNERAVELLGISPPAAGKPAWTPAKNLHDPSVRSRPNGHLYNTINVGIRNMPAYGTQVGPADRWAIVAYLRALQLSQDAPATAVPAGIVLPPPPPAPAPTSRPAATMPASLPTTSAGPTTAGAPTTGTTAPAGTLPAVPAPQTVPATGVADVATQPTTKTQPADAR